MAQTTTVGGETSTPYEPSVWYNGDYNHPHRDPSVLRGLYHGRHCSLRDTADWCGVKNNTIKKWMDRYNISTRCKHESMRNHYGEETPHGINQRGYETWEHTHRGDKNRVFVHRLMAVAEYGFDEIIDKDIHHQNHIPWDNRFENIEVWDSGEHSQYHWNEYWSKQDRPWDDPELLRELHIDEGYSHSEISDKLGCSRPTVSDMCSKYDISRNW